MERKGIERLWKTFWSLFPRLFARQLSFRILPEKWKGCLKKSNREKVVIRARGREREHVLCLWFVLQSLFSCCTARNFGYRIETSWWDSMNTAYGYVIPCWLRMIFCPGALIWKHAEKHVLLSCRVQASETSPQGDQEKSEKFARINTSIKLSPSRWRGHVIFCSNSLEDLFANIQTFERLNLELWCKFSQVATSFWRPTVPAVVVGYPRCCRRTGFAVRMRLMSWSELFSAAKFAGDVNPSNRLRNKSTLAPWGTEKVQQNFPFCRFLPVSLFDSFQENIELRQVIVDECGTSPEPEARSRWSPDRTGRSGWWQDFPKSMAGFRWQKYVAVATNAWYSRKCGSK